jgi:hypothetical protein
VVSTLVTPTESHDLAEQASAFTAHPVAAELGFGLEAIAAVLLTAGVIWFASRTHERAPRLSLAGGVLALLGILSIMFDDAVHLSSTVVVNGLTPEQGQPLLERLGSGGVVAVGPLAEIADLGIILLAVAAARMGVPRWAVVTICVGVLVEGAGFGAGVGAVAAVGFALEFVGYTAVVRTAFAGSPEAEPALAAPVTD